MKQRKKWTLTRVLSWFAGLSLGASFALVFLALLAATIFVRTDFFQTRLRDQVVQAVENSLDAEISYVEARVEVFRLFPRLSFTGVSLRDEETKLEVSIDRVSVSISLFYSLPLLAFRKIHISEAEVAGLTYELKNTEVIDVWLERLRPKTTVAIPSRFQTVVNEIHFLDFRLGLELSEKDVLKQAVSAALHLNEFTIQFDDDAMLLGGDLLVQELKTSGVEISDVSVEVEDVRLENRSMWIDSVAFQHKDDRVYVTGDVMDIEDPKLDLKLDASLRLENYVLPENPRGHLRAQIDIEGPLKALKGSAKTDFKNFEMRKAFIETVSASWSLAFPSLKLDSLEAQGLGGGFSASGELNFDSNTPSRFQVKTSSVSAGAVLSFVDSDFADWGGAIDSDSVLEFRGLGFKDLLLNVRALEVRDFIIRNLGDEIIILKVARAEVKGSLQHQNSAGGMSFDVLTDASKAKVSAQWSPGQYLMDWDLDVEDGQLAELFGMLVRGRGKITGSYGGRVGEMELVASPRMSEFSLNEFQLKNFNGDMRLKKARLFADPLTADGIQILGGLQFKRGDSAEFSELQVSLSQFPLEQVWGVIPIDNELAKTFRGKLSGSGVMNGWIMEPVGRGNFAIQDLAYSDDKTLGRLAKFNWEWNRRDIAIRDIYLETSRDGGGVRGQINLKGASLVAAQLEGTRVKYGDWALFFGKGLEIQSLTDFSLNFDESEQRLAGNLELYETIVGAVVQERSRFEVDANGDELRIKGQLFKDSVGFEFEAGSGNLLGGVVDIKRLNLIPLIRQLQNSGLSFPLVGKSRCNLIFDPELARRPAYYKLINLPQRASCEFKMNETQITRAASSLHEIQPFTIDVQAILGEGIAFKFSEIVVRTGEDQLRINANYHSRGKYEARLSGFTGLDSVSYFLPFLSRSDGRVKIEGVLDQTGFTGGVDLSNGMILFRDSPFVLRNVQASLKSINSTVDLTQFSGDARDGNLTASGRVQLANGFEVQSALLVVQLNGPLIEPRTGLRFRSSGPISLRIDAQGAVVRGQIAVYDGTFRQRVNLRSDLLRLFQPREERYQFVEREESYVDTWRLDLSLVTTEEFVIRNNIADGAADFNINIGGTVAQPRLSGSITVNRGRFNWNNRNFDIQAGSIQFSDQQSNIPRYDLRAETEVGDYRVFVTFQGDVNQQKIIYSSDPPLTEKEILALVSYGTPPGLDADLNQSDPTESAALTGISFVTGQLQDTIEGALSGDLGIQRFQVYPAFYDETGKTELQLTVGTDLIRNKLELNYSNFLTAEGGHEVQLGYRINRNIFLVGSWKDLPSSEDQNISGDFGGDVIFRFEFD